MTTVVLTILCLFFLGMIVSAHINLKEGMDVLEATKNIMSNNISASTDLGDRVEALKEEQPPTEQPGPFLVVGMDEVVNDVYKPIEVTCTLKDCDVADDLLKKGFNIAGSNYYNDGFRECDANICSKIRELNETMTPLDDNGAHFRDDKGNIYDFLGNLVNK